MNPPESTVVGIVIVAYNGAAWLRQSLSSCRRQGALVKCYVVDNASTDDTCRMVRAEFPEVELIELASNLGFGVGNNVGISRALAAGHEFVLLLNQDAWLPDDSVARLVNFMISHPEIGVASPLHCSPDLQDLDRRTLVGYLAPYACDWLCDLAMNRSREWYAVRGVNAAIWMVRASVFRRVGGFDPLFFMYGEDDDMLHRFAHHGIVFALVPGIRAVHLRQSPPAKELEGWPLVKARAQRQRSVLLRQVKEIGLSVALRLLILLREGFVTPAMDWLVERRTSTLLARWLAAVWILAELRTIHRHSVLLRHQGPHFLEHHP